MHPLPYGTIWPMGSHMAADDVTGTEPRPASGREPSVDGRTARRDRNRDAVLDAVIELFGEGLLMPAAAEVAERSGVSPRSVFRYFEDTDALSRAAIARRMEVVEPLLALPDAAVGSLEERIERVLDARLRLWDAAAPVARAVIVRAPVNPLLADQLDRNRRRLHAQVEEVFTAELDACEDDERQALLAAADLLTGYDSLDLLRRQQDRTAEETRDILARALRRLFR